MSKLIHISLKIKKDLNRERKKVFIGAGLPFLAGLDSIVIILSFFTTFQMGELLLLIALLLLVVLDFEEHKGTITFLIITGLYLWTFGADLASLKPELMAGG